MGITSPSQPLKLKCLQLNKKLQVIFGSYLSAVHIEDPDEIIKILLTRWNAKRNNHVRRKIFQYRIQRQDKKVDDWLCNLQDLTKKTDFATGCCVNCEPARFLGQVIFGFHDDKNEDEENTACVQFFPGTGAEFVAKTDKIYSSFLSLIRLSPAADPETAVGSTIQNLVSFNIKLDWMMDDGISKQVSSANSTKARFDSCIISTHPCLPIWYGRNVWWLRRLTLRILLLPSNYRWQTRQCSSLTL